MRGRPAAFLVSLWNVYGALLGTLFWNVLGHRLHQILRGKPAAFLMLIPVGTFIILWTH
jgi:hypothetical protein